MSAYCVFSPALVTITSNCMWKLMLINSLLSLGTS
jgi:hypothetical protein